MLDYFVYCHNYPVIVSNIPPYDFEPVHHSNLSITESTKSDTETEFINTKNNQHRVGAVSCHFRMVFVQAMRFNAYLFSLINELLIFYS